MPDGNGGFVRRPREEWEFVIVRDDSGQRFSSRREAWETYCPQFAPVMEP